MPCPTLFFTVSFANLRSLALQGLLGVNAKDKKQNKEIYEKLMKGKGNPHVQDQFFMQITQNIIELWLVQTLKAKYWWIRFEFQWRGSIHCHGVAWIPEPSPGLVKLADIAK